MTPGPFQIILIILLILLIFGAGRVPGIMENLAKGMKSFKRGMKDEEAGKEDTKVKSVSDESKQDDQANG